MSVDNFEASRIYEMFSNVPSEVMTVAKAVWENEGWSTSWEDFLKAACYDSDEEESVRQELSNASAAINAYNKFQRELLASVGQ